MSQFAPNSAKNINQPHGVSGWFRRDFTGDFVDLGDLLVDGINFTPEFSEVESYRGGARSVIKRNLSSRAGQVTLQLREPGIRSLALASYSSSPAKNVSETWQVHDSAHLTVEDNGGGEKVVDLGAADPALPGDLSDVTIIGVYDEDDVLLTNAHSNGGADSEFVSDGKVRITDSAVAIGDIVYVVYTIDRSVSFQAELFAAELAAIEGDLKIQARNQSGGIFQLWHFASAQLAPNGDISYPIDDLQSVPLLATLQARNGSFGTIYTV